MRRIFRLWALLLAPMCFCSNLSAQPGEIEYGAKELFPLPPSLEDAVRFWIRVYGVHECNEYVFHDMENLAVVYEVVRIESLDPERPDQQLHPDQRTSLQQKKDFYKRLLEELASPETDFDRLSGERKRVFDLFGGSRSREGYARAAGNIRAQKGQKNRFRRGLELKGRYLEFIHKALRSQGVPLELDALPHVESCYNYAARSSAGAAGIWQFTRPTGRLFLRIDHAIDERLDPIRSSEAAASLLRKLREELGSWPLAITAYNHGLGGMKKAKAALGTSDIGEIVARYRGPYFGFASRNFYAEFLAALHVTEHSVEYFGEIRPEAPLRFAEVDLPHPQSLPVVAKRLEVSVADLSALNPGLKTALLSGANRLPRGYRLRVPPHLPRTDLLARLSQEAPKSFAEAKSGEKDGGEVTPSPVSVPGVSDERRQSPAKEGRGIFRGVAVAEASVAELEHQGDPLVERSVFSAWRPAEIRMRGNGRPLTGSTRVEPEETAALYAAWLKVPVQRVLRWNGWGTGTRLRSGQSVKLVFEKVTPQEFQKARTAYHRGLEKDFLREHTVVRTFPHHLKKGETLWTLSEFYKVPYWLLKRYNADLGSRAPRSGDLIRIPELEGGARPGTQPST